MPSCAATCLCRSGRNNNSFEVVAIRLILDAQSADKLLIFDPVSGNVS